MKKELYFEIGTEGGGSEIYRITDDSGRVSFLKFHITYDADKDTVNKYEETYTTFNEYLNDFLKFPHWYFLHPVFVHNDLKPLMQKLINDAEHNLESDNDWKEHHKDNWNRVFME